MPLLLLLLLHCFGLAVAPGPRATVYVFLAETCPISQAATLPLRELHGRYGAQGVQFVGVFPAKETSAAGLAAFARTYQLAFPLQADAGHELTNKLHARVTPEAVVVAADGHTVLYQGRLDDAYAGLGQHRAVTRQHELADALAAVAAGRPIAVPRTEPVGCFIE
ncbi:redoxin family protein [Microvirga sp. STS02]|uniref:redoxin domain-containing protein n=1 Tax=Hymenobacter negativus TaxID=2795026 RepID=UPI0018DE64BB|nr:MULTISPECIES: redoxin domain-containing protein [Bacteria]MBH8567863.1 redoxin family protein [Hymenobacter negativus]MBR7207599.1 redoxin family protein [Microvirga sp. STS02]